MSRHDRGQNGEDAFGAAEGRSLSPAEGERENHPPRFRQPKAPGLVAARHAVPLPEGEGKGEGEPDVANHNGRTNLASSIPPAPPNRCPVLPKHKFPDTHSVRQA